MGMIKGYSMGKDLLILLSSYLMVGIHNYMRLSEISTVDKLAKEIKYRIYTVTYLLVIYCEWLQK